MVMDLATNITCPFGAANAQVILTTDQDMFLYGICMLAAAANGRQPVLQEGGCPEWQACRFVTGKEILLSEEDEEDEY
jgi:hypothetical protein